jgi:hypothetical protein
VDRDGAAGAHLTVPRHHPRDGDARHREAERERGRTPSWFPPKTKSRPNR